MDETRIPPTRHDSASLQEAAFFEMMNIPPRIIRSPEVSPNEPATSPHLGTALEGVPAVSEKHGRTWTYYQKCV